MEAEVHEEGGGVLQAVAGHHFVAGKVLDQKVDDPVVNELLSSQTSGNVDMNMEIFI